MTRMPNWYQCEASCCREVTTAIVYELTLASCLNPGCTMFCSVQLKMIRMETFQGKYAKIQTLSDLAALQGYRF